MRTVPAAADPGRDRPGRAPACGATAGGSLLEVLISLVVLTIGVLAVLSLLVTARRNAEAAADRAAVALAARQVLEVRVVGGGPGLPPERVFLIGVHRVRVSLEAESLSAGLVRLRARARDATGGRSWTVETLEAGP